MADPQDKRQRGPWEAFHRARRAREQLEDAAQAPADRVLDALDLPSVGEIGDELRELSERLRVPERFRPRLPRPRETWREIQHGVRWVEEQLEPLRDKLERLEPDRARREPPPGERGDVPGEDDDDGWGDVIAWLLFLLFLDHLSREELTFELNIDGALWTFTEEDDDGQLQLWNKQTFAPEAGFAARLGDVMMHGDVVAPGLGSPNVFIGGKPALRRCDSHVCTVTTPVPHVGAGFIATYDKVEINGFTALRVGDYVDEGTHGLNPITVGCPRVTIGPRPPEVECWAPGEELLPKIELFGFRWTKGELGHFKGKVVLGVDIGGPLVRVEGTVTAARLWAEETNTRDFPLGDIDGDGKVEAWRVTVHSKTMRALGVSDVEFEAHPVARRIDTAKVTPKPNQSELPEGKVERELVELES